MHDDYHTWRGPDRFCESVGQRKSSLGGFHPNIILKSGFTLTLSSFLPYNSLLFLPIIYLTNTFTSRHWYICVSISKIQNSSITKSTCPKRRALKTKSMSTPRSLKYELCRSVYSLRGGSIHSFCPPAVKEVHPVGGFPLNLPREYFFSPLDDAGNRHTWR